MSGIVITHANWRADHCPRCGISPYGRYSPVAWFTRRRGMCEFGHFIALDITNADFMAALDRITQEAS